MVDVTPTTGDLRGRKMDGKVTFRVSGLQGLAIRAWKDYTGEQGVHMDKKMIWHVLGPPKPFAMKSGRGKGLSCQTAF